MYRMAGIHQHSELGEWSETRVAVGLDDRNRNLVQIGVFGAVDKFMR